MHGGMVATKVTGFAAAFMYILFGLIVVGVVIYLQHKSKGADEQH